MIDIAKLAAMIKSKRGSKGLRSVAEEIGTISSSTLSRVELGNLPDIDTYVALCRWLGVSTDYFVINAGERATESAEHRIEVHLRADRNLSQETTEALITLIKLAYAKESKNNQQGLAT